LTLRGGVRPRLPRLPEAIDRVLLQRTPWTKKLLSKTGCRLRIQLLSVVGHGGRSGPRSTSDWVAVNRNRVIRLQKLFYQVQTQTVDLLDPRVVVAVWSPAKVAATPKTFLQVKTSLDKVSQLAIAAEPGTGSLLSSWPRKVATGFREKNSIAQPCLANQLATLNF